MPNSELVQSLQRGVKLLRCSAGNPAGMRLSDLAAACGLQKSTAHNLVRTLCAEGFLLKDQHQRFRIGSGLLELLSGYTHTDLMDRFEQALAGLRQDFPEDIITISTFDRTVVRCVLRVSGENSDIEKPLNKTFPPYITMTALALHTYWRNVIEHYYPFEDYGEAVWNSPENFYKVLDSTIKQGYCWQKRERMFSAAFIMPEGWVLGFSRSNNPSTHSATGIVNSWLQASKKFCSQIWNDSASAE